MTLCNAPFRLFELSGRTALVTGATRGLGNAIATAFVQAGASVVITGKDHERLNEAADIMRGHGESVSVACACDLSTRSGVREMGRYLAAYPDAIDIVVNNAGEYVDTILQGLTEDEWDRMVELNLSSCVFLTKVVVPSMKERNWGGVIFLSSILASASRAGSLAYSAAKSALLGVARSSAIELGPYGITVNCIAPGPFNVCDPDAEPTTHQSEKFSRWAALGRWGRPSEIVGPALLLASEAGSYITGSVLTVDGGALARTLAE